MNTLWDHTNRRTRRCEVSIQSMLLDFFLVKNFRMYESQNLQFRTEQFNAANHPNF